MDSIELEQCLTQNPFTKKYFKEVVSCDRLPRKYIEIDKTFEKIMFISNTKPRTHKGEHWVVFVVSKRQIEYFDSLGKPYKTNKYFNQFINTNKRHRKIVFFKKKLQSDISNCCGEYSALYILARSKNVSFKKFFKFFNKELLENDILALKTFKKNFKCRNLRIKPNIMQNCKSPYDCRKSK